jgi:hypothetical protein
MSGLTGYLTKNGLDLSSVFVSSNTATFANAITTHAGIIAPPTNLTYTSNMIGYTVKIPGTKTNGGITSGATVSLSGTTPFTIQTGLYILYLYISNAYQSGPGFLNFINVSLSTSSTSFASGSGGTLIGSIQLTGITGNLEGGLTTYMKITTATPYYLVENVNFTSGGITVSTLAPSSYVQYTRIA